MGHTGNESNALLLFMSLIVVN